MAPIKPFLLLLVVICFFIVCQQEKAKTTTPENNVFYINDSPNSITTFGLSNLGPDPSGNQYQGYLKVLLLLSEGITMSEDPTGLLYLKGKGTLLGILLYNQTATTLTEGDYYVDLRPPHEIGEASIGFYTLAFDESLVNGPYLNYPGLALLSGKISIKNKQQSVELTLDLIDENGKSISGTVIQKPTPFHIAALKNNPSQKPPVLLGLAEIENREVLELLLQTKPLRSLGYAIAHFDSPDARGIDVALLYQPQHFQLDFAKKYRLRLQSEHKQRFRTTRDQLVVSGFLEGAPLTVLVNHWPSRRGGAKRSNPLRMAAARLQAKLIDSLQRLDANPQIISMGDFNDNPNNASIAYLTKPQKLNKHSEREPLFNATEKLFNKGVGSLAHNDQWFLFDQILLSNSFKSREKLFHLGTKVFNPPFLRTPEGRYKGYPYRTHQKGELLLGYSDHFPVYVVLGLQVR